MSFPSVRTKSRSQYVKTALRLELLSIVWMVIEAVVSIGAGIKTGSLLMVAFGVDSLIELASACLLYYRLSRETKSVPSGGSELERIERNAARIGGYLLFLLALYVFVQSGIGLFHRHSADSSLIGIMVAVIAAVGMPLLAKAKIRVADEIGSRALRADAMETLTCGYLSWVLLAGLAANALLHWWWLDSVAALILVPFLINEGREAIIGECCCDCDVGK